MSANAWVLNNFKMRTIMPQISGLHTLKTHDGVRWQTVSVVGPYDLIVIVAGFLLGLLFSSEDEDNIFLCLSVICSTEAALGNATSPLNSISPKT